MERHGEESNLKIDWNQIDTILLDLDGTLLDLNFDLEFWLEYIPEIYSKKNNIKLEDAKKIVISMINYHNDYKIIIKRYSLQCKK